MTRLPSQKQTGEQPPEDRTMTWDELEELRDRLSNILERERAEDGFCPIEADYYILYRQAARRAVADIDPDHSRDRDHYQTLQEIYDAVGEIYDIRSAKLRMAVKDRVVFRRDGERPENLTEEERDRYNMAISLGGHNAE
jgi:DNA replication initiation complex subunit (GINS family)